MTSNNDQTLPPSIELIRPLRMARRAAEACALIRQLDKTPPPDLYIGQLGIDMNYLGLFKEAEAPLRRSLQDDHMLSNRYKISVELCTVLYLQGRYHEAHALHRETISRMARCRETARRSEIHGA